MGCSMSGDFAEDGYQQWATGGKTVDGPYYVWTTKDGQRLPMHKIEDRHLINIIRLLKRKSLEALNDGYSALCFLQGEHAIDAAQSSIDGDQHEYAEMIGMFTDEALSRGLAV